MREKFVESSLMLHSVRQSSSSWHHGSLSLPSVLGVRSVHRVLSPYIRSQYSLLLFSHTGLSQSSLSLCSLCSYYAHKVSPLHRNHWSYTSSTERKRYGRSDGRRKECGADAAVGMQHRPRGFREYRRREQCTRPMELQTRESRGTPRDGQPRAGAF